jgi:D-glycero-D-manno-heptose 1,7-bisphosphate phosphatase
MTPVPKLLIVGRDGILNHYSEAHIKSPQEWVAIPGALEGLAQLNHEGWHVVVATNQSGIGRGMIDMASVNAIHAHMMSECQAVGARIDAVFLCPHTPEEACACRKPLPGLMLEIGERYGVELSEVPMAVDTLRDLLAAQAAGCQPHLVLTGRATALDAAQLKTIAEQVPAAHQHASLAAMAAFLLAREPASNARAG